MEKNCIRHIKNPFTSKMKLNARNRSVNYYIRSIAFYDNRTWTLGKVDQQYWTILKCGADERWMSFGPIV